MVTTSSKRTISRWLDHHSNAIGEGLAWHLSHLPSDWTSKNTTHSSITIGVSFKAPYKSRFGLVNLEYLRQLAPPLFNPEILRPLLKKCLEIRGLPEVQGVYIPVTYLDEEIFAALQLRFDSRKVDESRYKLLDGFTHIH